MRATNPSLHRLYFVTWIVSVIEVILNGRSIFWVKNPFEFNFERLLKEYYRDVFYNYLLRRRLYLDYRGFKMWKNIPLSFQAIENSWKLL
jgi:hypothetical protein